MKLRCQINKRWPLLTRSIRTKRKTKEVKSKDILNTKDIKQDEKETKKIEKLILMDVKSMNKTEDLEKDFELPTSKLLQTVKDYQNQNPSHIALIRVGDFYELYYEQAVKMGQVLGMIVVKKTVKNHTFDFTGFPAKNLEKHLETIINAGFDVAILEQYQDEITKQFYRKVNRIYTKGTLVSESFIDNSRANYLLCIFKQRANVGLAWMDVSTGEFYIDEIRLDNILDELAVIQPKEIVINEKEIQLIKLLKDYKLTIEKEEIFQKNKNKIYKDIMKQVKKQSGIIQYASFGIINYFDKVFGSNCLNVQIPIHKNEITTLKMDKQVIDSLELFQGKNSLFSFLNHTVTKPGSRLLFNQLSRPSTDIQSILNKYQLINALQSDKIGLDKLRNVLKEVKDVQKKIQKLSLNLGGLNDLYDIIVMLNIINNIKQILLNYFSNNQKLNDIAGSLEFNPRFKNFLENGLKIDNEMNISINMDFNKQLTELHKNLMELKSQREALETHLRYKLECKSLKLITSSGLGNLIEILPKDSNNFKKNQSQLKNKPILFQSLKGKERYYFEDWSVLATNIENMEQNIIDEEKNIFILINKKVLDYRETLIKLSQIIAMIDVASTIALLSKKYQLIEPNLVEKNVLNITSCRHLPVELSLKNKFKNFTTNDIKMSSNNNVWVITGPNMGGKSTFLRMVAINIIMAQAGFFIPANSAEIGIVDAVYSRIGSGDNLTNEQSTFMVEMQEAAHILDKATSKSLVIIDEIGRGTSIQEGESLAYGILNQLHNIGCRTLFATHFHQLANSLNRLGLKKCVNFHTNIIELEDDSFAFLHQLIEGCAKDSAAFRTAQLAGIDKEVLEISKTYLDMITKSSTISNIDDINKEKVIMQIRNQNLDTLSPFQALLFLKKVKELL